MNVCIIQEHETAEYRSYQEHFADLFEGIQEPVSLSLRLFSAGLLHRDTRRTICSLERPVQQRTELLDAVERQIRVDPQNFYKFVDELEKDSPMQHLCDKLRSTCGACDNLCLSTSTDQWCSGVAQLKLNRVVCWLLLSVSWTSFFNVKLHLEHLDYMTYGQAWWSG